MRRRKRRIREEEEAEESAIDCHPMKEVVGVGVSNNYGYDIALTHHIM